MNKNSVPNGRSHRNRNSEKWYQKTVWIILLLILCFPVGIFLMWKYTNWKKAVKIVISALFIFFFYSAATAPKLESVNLLADTNKEYDINEAIEITPEIEPDSYVISSSSYKSSGGEIKISGDKVLFTSDKPGTYKVSVKSSGIKSNTLTFKIEDKAAIAKAKAKKEAEKLKKKAEIEAAAAIKKSKEEAAAKKAEEEAAARQAEEEAQKKALEEAAAKKAEEERLAAQAAAQQAEQERIVAEQAAQAAEQPQEQMVWISATGSKYHSYSSCGNMNPDNAYQMTLSDAQASGYEACKNCH